MVLYCCRKEKKDIFYTLSHYKLMWYPLIELGNELNLMHPSFDYCSVFRKHFLWFLDCWMWRIYYGYIQILVGNYWRESRTVRMFTASVSVPEFSKSRPADAIVHGTLTYRWQMLLKAERLYHVCTLNNVWCGLSWLSCCFLFGTISSDKHCVYAYSTAPCVIDHFPVLDIIRYKVIKFLCVVFADIELFYGAILTDFNIKYLLK